VDCPYDGGICLTQAQGFLEGTCSQDCTRFCPDFNLDGGFSMTFCVDPPAGATGAAVDAFAAGALLVMLTDSMIPESFEHGDREAGLFLVMGFGVALMMTLAQLPT